MMPRLKDVTIIEWLIVAVIVMILVAVVMSGVDRRERCRAILASAQTASDSLNVRLACEVRTGYRRY